MTKPVAIGCNIFAGGFTLGVAKHFKVLGHLEHDTYGANVIKLNMPHIPLYQGTDQWPTRRDIGQPHFIYSNPPCAVWSCAGAKCNAGSGWKNDPRVQRVYDSFNLIDRFRPNVWCWESVTQAFGKGRDLVDELHRRAARMGYSTTALLIDAQWLGVPQTRRRFFMITHNIELRWQVPSFNERWRIDEVLRHVKPVRALIPPMPESHTALIRHTQPGRRLTDAFNEMRSDRQLENIVKRHGKMTGRPSFLHVRVRRDRPSPTIIGPTRWHWSQPRPLAINELQVLCGFPTTWRWPDIHTHEMANLMARGVLPPVGEWLARQVKRSLQQPKHLRTPQRWTVDFRQAPGNIQQL